MPKHIQYLTEASHDWLGEAAEHYVRYIFAREKLKVFAGDKWGADCAVYDEDSKRLIRVEVKSTDRQKRPAWSSTKVNAKGADWVAEVRFHSKKDAVDGPHTIGVTLYRAKDGRNGTGYPVRTRAKNEGVHFFMEKPNDEISLRQFLFRI